MPMLAFNSATGLPRFEAEPCAELGTSLHERYATASPFPHIVMDDFIAPDLLRAMMDGFPDRAGKSHFDRDQERLKFQFQPWELEHGGLRNLLAELNSRAFLKFLENLSGIKGLIPDPYYLGGGLHETMPGGHLSVHADFNIHTKLRLERRLNFLLYLNDDWQPDYGGDLELWDKDMTARQKVVAPLLGRAVVFSTTLESFHGHPDPLRCPPGRSRRSIATYYYTAPEEGVASLPKRTTIFKQRDRTEKADRQVGYEHFVNDWVPFRLQPLARRVGRKLF